MKDNKVKKSSSSSKNDEEKFIEENDDQRVIVFVAIAVLVVIGIVIGLLAGCQKDKEKELEDPNKPVEKENDSEKEDKVVDYKEDEEDESDTLVVKTTTKNKKKKERKSFKVEFLLLNNNSSDILSIKEGKKVKPIEPDGYEKCEYYLDVDSTEEYDFTTIIKEDTTIYMECELINYGIEYVGTFENNSDNPDSYDVEKGIVNLEDPTVNNIFLGWYLDSDFDIKVSSLKPIYIDYALDKVITLYAKQVDSLKVVYHYNVEDTSVKSEKDIEDVEYTIEDLANTVVLPEGMTFYGWTTSPGGKSIKYKTGAEITLTGDLDLYPVYGNAKVVFQSESEVVEERVYTNEELENIVLPTDSDLDLETPTYYVKVDTPTDTSKEVVSDEVTPTEGQVKVGEVTDKKGSSYGTPEVGDNVEEHEKVFEGWETTITNTEEPPTEETVPVDEDFEFVEDETVLDAVWEEQEEDKVQTPPEPGPLTSSNVELPESDSEPVPEIEEETILEPVTLEPEVFEEIEL